MRTVIVDYNSGNLHSAEKAFRRMAIESDNGDVLLSSNPDEVAKADRLVLPGVGAFADCRNGLVQNGLEEAVQQAAIKRGVPFLGICVGMQLMATIGHEMGITHGFDWIPGEVKPLERHNAEMKIPHMGWNQLDDVADHALFDGIGGGTDVYFVHSYHLVPDSENNCIAVTDYGGDVTAAVATENLAGTQFHPEKSQAAGLRIIANFLSWNPG
ncbi:MAG: imidazole glycerol phosphate synthase subunit HisH [Rhodobacteraceae bacterium]|nr:imidazole glycerol phosphate synthase subunit HisH [Paracoccaceae bacterium]MCY4197220.1 imidazole glycerol phosphate synthase subunit HisH [Paracoccaceae bacterium]MCY4327226.1 imidazole glycerol phosphate synthase subunit HisH [Paracoccaceae bacterium]